MNEACKTWAVVWPLFLFSIFLKFDQKNKKALICRTFSSWENKAWAKANNTNLHDGMLRKYTPEQIDFALEVAYRSYSEISKKLGISKTPIYRRFRELKNAK